MRFTAAPSETPGRSPNEIDMRELADVCGPTVAGTRTTSGTRAAPAVVLESVIVYEFGVLLIFRVELERHFVLRLRSAVGVDD